MKKIFKLLLLVIWAQFAAAQVKVNTLGKKEVPSIIKYAGHIINAVQFTDNQGEHLVITTETGMVQSKEKDFDGRDASLYAYHYDKLNGNEWKLTWQVYDFIKDCPVDLTAAYLPHTFAITDLNKNGKAEVWLMYKTVCHGDVSPSTMKIIMHEGDMKYAIRGTNKVKLSEHEFEGGTYTLDNAFKTAPDVFKQYALSLWKKNLMETWK